MLYRRAPVASQLESLRYLNCADIFSVSLVNSAYFSLVDSNRASLPKRAISIRYWQGYPDTAPSEDPDPETLEEYEAYEAVVEAAGGDAVVGSLEIQEKSGTNKRIFRAFPLAFYEAHEENPLYYCPIPEQVEQDLRRVLFDRVLGVVERLDVNNYSTIDFSSKMFSLLCTAIEVPVWELHARIEHAVDPADVERLVEQLGSKVQIHYFQFNPHAANCVKVCAGFGGVTIFAMDEWCEEPAETLVEHILTSRYNPQCRLLLRLGEYNPSRILLRVIGVLFRQLYAVFADSWKQISLPQHGLWLYFPAVQQGLLPDNLWMRSSGGTEPSSTRQEDVTLPVPKGVYGESNGDKQVKCAVYQHTAAQREQTLRVCVALSEEGDAPLLPLLVQLKLQ